MRRGILTMAATAVLAVATLGPPPAGAEPNGPADPVHAATPTARFVWSAHADFLDRDPTAAELETQTAAIDAGTTSRRRLVTDLSTSPEWVATVVDQLYLDTLGRPADPTGRAHWISRLSSGTTTVAQAAAAFYASPEYYRGLGGGTVATWVDDLYLKILGRPADPGGRAYWIAETTRTTRTSVAHRFYQSREPVGRRVTGLYQTLLGRAPDPAGRDHWVARLPHLGDLALARELAASTEYADRADRRFALESLTRLPPHETEHGPWSSAMSMSADGRFVVWSAAPQDGPGEIRAWDRTTGATSTVFADPDRNAFGPAISADGRRIAFQTHAVAEGSGPTVSRVEIWDRTTGERTVIADDGAPVTHVTIDATGDHVAYLAATPGEPWQVWLWAADAGGIQVTDGNRWSTHAAVSGDGRRLAVASQATDLVADDLGAGLFLWDEADGLTRISADDEAASPSISSNGSTVVFEAPTGSGLGVHVWSATTGDRMLVENVDPGGPWSVSGDGRFVAMVDRSGGSPSVVVVDRLLDRTHRVPVDHPTVLPSISADGSIVAFRTDPTAMGSPDSRHVWSRPRFLG